MTELYDFSNTERKCFERLNFGLAIFQIAEKRLLPLLVSDGLCQFYQLPRPRLLDHLASSNYLAQNLIGAKQQLLSSRVKLGDTYHTVLLHAAEQDVDGYQLLYVDFLDFGEDRVNQKKTAQTPLLPLADHFQDTLTNLFNGDYLMRFGQDYLTSKLQQGDSPLVLMFNIVGMHSYNERFGYQAGDAFLYKFSQELLTTFAEDLVVRYGDDHFIVLSVKHNYIDKIKLLEDFATKNYKIAGIKAGVYYYSDSGESIKSAIDKARRALQYTGSDLTQIYHVFDDDVIDCYVNHDYVLTHFQEALDKRWIQPYYQAELRTLTGEVAGFEALARWIDPERGLLSPASFVGILEDTHLVTQLDLAIINQVCERLSYLYQNGLPVVPVSVNLSPIDFQVADIFQEVDNIRQKHKIPAHFLNIEILESTLTSVPQQLHRAITKFHAAGYQIWMDDFGSGYSSLNNLKDFNFDLLKIDMIFLRNFTKNNKSKIILREIVDMAKRLGIHTLCEGVENQDQADFLREIGCEHLQGFLFSRPLPLTDIIQKTNKWVYEPVDMNDYYDKVGMTNLLSDPMIEPISQGIKLLSVPLALIERRDGKIKYCFINQAHHNSLEKFSLSMADWERFMNEDEYSRKLLLRLMTDSKSANQRIGSHLDDQIYLEVKYLASYQTRDMFVVSMKNFNNYLDKTRQDKTRQDKTRQDKTSKKSAS